MAEEVQDSFIARDSGICVDNDSPSLSTSSSCRDFNQLSYVQRLRKRFECLAKEQEKEFHTECNWWLEDDYAVKSVASNDNYKENISDDVVSKVLLRNVSADSVNKVYSKQSSLKSQISLSSLGNVTITPSTPVKTPTSPENFPTSVTLIDFQGNNETNDSDSFDSEESENEQSVQVEVEEVLPAEYIRNSRQSLKLLRPISTTSQTSK